MEGSMVAQMGSALMGVENVSCKISAARTTCNACKSPEKGKKWLKAKEMAEKQRKKQTLNLQPP
jgi:hypothetical protein